MNLLNYLMFSAQWSIEYGMSVENLNHKKTASTCSTYTLYTHADAHTLKAAYRSH